jgi:hypothetical protein
MSGEYPGRRLRCDGCGARLTGDGAYEHARACGSTVSYPYRPDRVREGEQTDLTAFGP